jgi:hypothetical protein
MDEKLDDALVNKKFFNVYLMFSNADDPRTHRNLLCTYKVFSGMVFQADAINDQAIPGIQAETFKPEFSLPGL